MEGNVQYELKENKFLKGILKIKEELDEKETGIRSVIETAYLLTQSNKTVSLDLFKDISEESILEAINRVENLTIYKKFWDEVISLEFAKDNFSLIDGVGDDEFSDLFF